MSQEKNYYRIILGQGNQFAEVAESEGFIGTDYEINQDLKNELSDDWRDFNKKFIPVYQSIWPEKSKISAGLACGALWTVSKGIGNGDVVLSPRGDGTYLVGEVTGDYEWHPGKPLPHRRKVQWTKTRIEKSQMSNEMRNSVGSIGTSCNITKYGKEINDLISGKNVSPIISTDDLIEDPIVFAMEKHLEDFLVKNWSFTELGSDYDIFQDNGDQVGQQFPTDTGPIDILAISKDKKEILVVELKKGRASDAVVGQILRYMGYISEVLAEDYQVVKGMIIALEDDIKIRRALSVSTNIDFYRYQVSFELKKAS